MSVCKYVGETIGDLAKTTGVSWRPIRIFFLENENDSTSYQ